MTSDTLLHESAEAPGAVSHQPPPRLSNGRIVLGALCVLLGILWLIDAAGISELRWRVLLPAALTVVGATLLVTARRTAHGGLVALGIVLTVLVLASSVVPGATPLAGIGERVERPPSLAEATDGYELGMGTLTVDLRSLTDGADGQEVSASVGMGELVVLLPEGVGARVRARSGVGEVTVAGVTRSGVGVSLTETVAGRSTLVLDLSVGIGSVEVRR